MTKSLTYSIAALAAFVTFGCAQDGSGKKTAPEAETKAPEATAPAAIAGAPQAPAGDSDAYSPLSATPEMDKAIADAKASGDKKKLAT
ncbi:MAG: hypothetical protein RJB05_1361, partial [Armatimonadota bacterium]